MANRSAKSVYEPLRLAYIQQLVAGAKIVDHSVAARAAGTTTRTADKAWFRGWPATAARGPLLPLRVLLAPSAEPAAPTTASPPPPAASNSYSPSEAPDLPQPAEPASVAAAPVQATVVATSVVPTRPDPTEKEERAVDVCRHALEGVASVATHLLAGLVPLAAIARKNLEAAAQNGMAEPRLVVDLTERTANALAKTANALASLVASQSTLSGRIQTRSAHAHAIVPMPPPASDVTADLSAKLLAALTRTHPPAAGPEDEGEYSGEEPGRRGQPGDDTAVA